MGRYYSGQISGKFWFAIQNSDDASNFGVQYKEEINYYVCYCPYENKENYCIDCFSSREEHMEAIKDEFDEYYDETWNMDFNQISYQFTENDIDKVKECIKNIELKVGKYMDSYVINDDEDTNEITYDISNDNFPSDKLELELIARLSLGKQILYCLEKYGTCNFTAEL
jgi:hypothetical protein